MYATALLAPIATGLLTTITPTTPIAIPSLLAGLLGTSVALGLQGPQLSVQTLLPTRDVPIGTAMIMFGTGMGSALFVCAAATLFHDRLGAEVGKVISAAANGTGNATNTLGGSITGSSSGSALVGVGLSDLRELVGPDKLMEVLGGYNEAVVQTMYLPLVLSCLICLGAVGTERVSMKKKQS